jgi:hypothetical protein
MKTRIIFLALIMLACLTGWAWAQPDDPGVNYGFYGTVTFHDCDCDNPYERVEIWQAGSPHQLYGVVCNDNPKWYNTRSTGIGGAPKLYAPGYYYLSFSLMAGSGDCTYTVVQYVYHGGEDQQVNLDAYLRDPNP